MSAKNVFGIEGGKKENPCIRCGDAHELIACPQVRYIELFDDGTLAAVEFFDWPPPKPSKAA